ncbi:hypothetical protein [Commensalibacter oyaizuii]|uniref:Uncharacterized protein n=1 Tax=Commensalibacter oyaizuii TaxID=3043873 RepID=A0ABT6Q5I9_9PROT|nr:hypothetical protein [Commensalibacter sp. TBRC 16381]MDI2091826.1 hypothetical protein [Commensalibacter sp. TBRC 16381]
MQKINKFVENCEALPFEDQKKIALELLPLLYHHTEIYTLPNYRLTKYLLQFLQEWEKLSEPSAIIYQWLGFLAQDVSYYQKGFAIDSNNQVCLNAIINFYLERLYFSTHHLNESFFIGDLNDSFEILDILAGLIPQITCETDQQAYMQEFKTYFELIHAWKKYSNQKLTIPFYDWYNQQTEYCENPLKKGNHFYYHSKKP